MINWMRQIGSITLVNLRTIAQRRGAAIAAAVGIAGVVAVLVGVLSIAEGFRAAMKVTGPDDVAIVLRSGADSEMTSGFSREEARFIAMPGVAQRRRTPRFGRAVCHDQPSQVARRERTQTCPARGRESRPSRARGDIRIVQGRELRTRQERSDRRRRRARAFAGLDVGKKIRVGQNEWEIVGVFAGGGGAAESEIWTDAPVLQSAYNRGDSFQSVYAKLTSPQAFTQFKDALTSNPRLKVKTLLQGEFLAEQSSMLTGFIRTLGVFIAALMAWCVFGALNTMYSAVAARTGEIATLRMVARASPIALSVLIESLVLALLGGTAGRWRRIWPSTASRPPPSRQTFSQIAFAFKVNRPPATRSSGPRASVCWGFFPAIRATGCRLHRRCGRRKQLSCRGDA